jgi:hypothetical protein
LAIESQQQAFEKFERDAVRVPDSDNKEAKRVHPEVRGEVEEKLETIARTFLSGSYSRKVQVVRLNDVDVIVVLADPEGRYSGSALAALEDIRAVAEGCGMVLDTDLGVRAVKLVLREHEFTVDLVAALEPGNGEDGLLLARHRPDEGYDDWQLLNPQGQRKAASAKNEECDGIYVPGVRTVKYWNEGLDKPLRSYHAESILWHALGGPVEFPELVVRFFDEAYERLAPGATTPDPGAPDADPVDKLLDDGERAAARNKVEDARRIAHDAFEKEDLEESLERWADLFGPSFPAPGTSTNNLGAALGAGAAGIRGPGVRPGKGREAIKTRSWRKG